jgi:uncharacterized protein (TIGR02145 family)
VFIPCGEVGATWTLQDTRAHGNNKSYKVKKMADGHIWMVQSLMFGDCTNNVYYNNDSKASTTLTPTVAPGYVGHCSAATSSDTPSNRAYLYNWPAAMNNENAYFSSTVTGFYCTGTAGGTGSPNPGACQGICPEGWHIPTGDTTGEFQALHDAGGCSTSNDDCWDAASAFEGVLGGYLYADGTPYRQGLEGCYWSSASKNGGGAYYLYFDSGSTSPGTAHTYRQFGNAVRCVRNY